jgi:gag-polypeptide of LTR copia-type
MAEKTQTIIRENPNISTSLRLTSMLLNGKNYQSWAKAATISLRDKGKLGYTHGNKPKPITPTETEEWEIQDSVVMSWLLHSMEPQIIEQFVHRADTSQKLWEKPKK